MSYHITEYTKQKAKEINVIVRPSTNKNKKIDVFDDTNKKIASIGSIKHKDYPTYLKENTCVGHKPAVAKAMLEQLADERRRLYYIRHSKDNGINGYLSKYLLW